MSSDTSTSNPPSELRPARTQRSIWRPEHEGGWWRSRWLRRVAAVAIFLGVLAALAWLVFPPLYHPNAQLVFLSGGNYRPFRAPPTAYAIEDFDALEPLKSLLTQRSAEPGPVLLTQMKSAAEMRRLSATLGELTPETSGVLIVYIDGHGVSEGGTAYLLCQNYDPSNPGPGRLPIDELLKQVGRSAAPVKLLILDAGRIESDPQAGMLINEFPRLLRQAVEQADDPTLWVLSSNTMFERSHVSECWNDPCSATSFPRVWKAPPTWTTTA